MRTALARVQALSGETWTDYNTHDPGVTLLEALSFGINDVAYRCGHPFADLMASSLAQTGLQPQDLSIETGDKALTGAPVTLNDYRKVLYDRVFGLKNVWLRASGRPGRYDAHIHTYSEPLSGPRTQPPVDEIVAQARQCLLSARQMGDSIGAVGLVPTTPLCLQGTVEIAAGSHPEDLMAEVFLAIEERLNPTPMIQDLDSALRSGASPDKIFEGPELELGVIPDHSLAPMNSEISRPVVMQAILSVAGVTGAQLSHLPKSSDSLPIAPRDAAGLQGLVLTQAGRVQRVDHSRVLLIMRHKEQTKRYRVLYQMKTLRDQAYARLPLGRVRPVSRYRSVQYILPAAYGLGPQGLSANAVRVVHPLSQVMPRQDARARLAEINQLRGYLLPFEQILADALAQLAEMAELFGTRAAQTSYASAPLAGAASTASLPPGASDILLEGTDPAQRAKDHAALVAAFDPWADRKERAYDHLLARIGEPFDDAGLTRLALRDTDAPRDAQRAELKRRFLSAHRALQAHRGAGVLLDEIDAPAHAPAQVRAQLLSGLDQPPIVIENALLTDRAAEMAIPDLQIGTSFEIVDGRAQFRARDAFSDVCTCAGPCEHMPDPVWGVQLGAGLHAVVRDGAWPSLMAPVAQALVQGACWHVTPADGYRLHLTLRAPGATLHLIETAACRADAKALVAGLASDARAWLDRAGAKPAFMRPVALPPDLTQHRVTAVIAARDGDHAAWSARNLADALPAHLTLDWYHLDAPQAACFAAHHAAWLAAQRKRRAPDARTPEADAAVETAAAGESARIGLWLHRLYGQRHLNRFPP